MLNLAANPTLADIQRYVVELERERGFSTDTVLQKCLLLGEEIGELFKAIRKTEGFSMDPNSKTGTVDEEFADVIVLLCTIANRRGIDLEQAFRDKEERNKTRVWVTEAKESTKA